MMKRAEFVELSRDVLKKGSCLRFRVKGMSMYPFINSGQVIHVKQAEPSDISYADIIYYCDRDDRIIAHRVVKKTKRNGRTAFLTKGDFALLTDGYVYAERVLGKVVAVEKHNKILRIDRGIFRVINILYSGSLPLSRWIYLLFAKIIRCFDALAGGKKILPDEEAWLFSLAQINLSVNKEKMLEKFPALSLDWNYIIQRAKEEGVTGLIYRSLRKLALHMYLPEEDLAVLEKGYYVNSARNAIIFRQAGKILKAVCAHEIKVVMLKGVFLAEKVYLDIGLRPMSDIDVLVKKEDVSRVNDVLNSLGYFSADYQGFSPDLPAMSINTLVYKTPELLCAPVHLHWHIINSTWPVDSLVRGIDMESIWQRAQPVIIEGENVYTLSPEHLVIYLAQHCLMHKFRPMTLFSDLTGALGYYNKSLDREFMLKEAERFDLKEILFCCLYFMRKKFAYEPPEVKEIDFGDMDFFRKLCNFFIAQDGDYYRLSYLVFLSKQKGIARKFKFLIKTFFPSARVITHNSGILPQQVNLPFYVKRICAHLFKSRMKS